MMIDNEKIAKKASKLRDEFRKKYNSIAVKFNEVCLEIDALLAEIAGEENAEG